MSSAITAAREALEKIPVLECSCGAFVAIRLAIAQLRAAEAEAGWRPIAEAKPGERVIVGRVHRGEFEWKVTTFSNIATEDGYTVYMRVSPPVMEGE